MAWWCASVLAVHDSSPHAASPTAPRVHTGLLLLWAGAGGVCAAAAELSLLPAAVPERELVAVVDVALDQQRPAQLGLEERVLQRRAAPEP